MRGIDAFDGMVGGDQITAQTAVFGAAIMVGYVLGISIEIWWNNKQALISTQNTGRSKGQNDNENAVELWLSWKCRCHVV